MNRRTLYVAAAFIAAAPFAAVVAWTGPTGAPPNNNTNGPVWLQTGAVTAQTGKISISGATINAATTTQDLYVSTGKAIRADGSGATTFNFGNYGTGASAFTLGVFGNVNVAGFGGANGTLTASQLCLPGSNPTGGCITTWPSGGGGYPGDIFVNTVGDTMTGQLFINPSAAGQTALSVTTNGIGSDGIYVTAVEHGILSSATAGYGLSGNSVNSIGVLGQTANAGSFGGIFYNNSAALNARAIVGVADNCVNGAANCGAVAIDGFAQNGTGVRGHSQNQVGPGVYGFGFYGVQGVGMTGMRADGTAAFGVEGRGPVAGVIGYGTGGANTAGVRGENSVANAYGVYGINSGAGGRAIFGETSAANTQAIRGYANVSGGIGVQGETGDLNGIGVHGRAITGTTGAIGVKGESNSPNAYGVDALATGSAGTGLRAVGPYGASITGNAAIGLQVSATAAGANGIVVQANTANADGVFSRAGARGLAGEGTQAGSIGVDGYSIGSNGIGVQGRGGLYGGMFGVGNGGAIPNSRIGVVATGTNHGAIFEATGYVTDPYVRLATCSQSNCSTETGVYAFGNIAVFGQAATNGIGVRGDAPGTGTGVTGNGGSFGGRFDGSTYDVVLAADGRVNSESSPMRFYVAGTENVRFATGGATTKSAGTTWGTAFSDARLKNVQGSFKGGLDEIMKLNPVYFNWKKGNSEGLESDMKHLGFIAQDVQKVFPEMVAERESGYLGIDSYDPIMWAMLNSIKELKTENDALKDSLNDLKSRVEKLEAAN